MRNLNTLLISSVLALTLGACGKDGKGAKSPDQSSGTPDAPSAKAKEDFAAAVKVYEKAIADGKLVGDECNRTAAAFEKVYKKHKGSMAIAKFNAGVIYERCGNLEQAEKIYEELAKNNYHLALNNLGVLAWNKGKTQRALDLFKRSVDADRKQAFAARNNLAAAHRDRFKDNADMKDFQVAEKQIQNVLAVDSSNKAAYENLARLYYDRGRLKDRSYLVLADLVVTQAIRVLEQQGQKSADIYNLRGLLFLERDGNQIDALKQFKKAVEVDSKHVDANLNIAFISIRFRDYAAAEKSLDIALKSKTQSRNVEAYLAMGVAKRGLKKFTESKKFYKKAAEIKKSDPRPWFNLGILNQEHLVGMDGVDQKKIEELYNTAKKHYQKFISVAGAKKEYADDVKEAKNRVIIIDDAIEAFREMERLEAEAKKLAEQEKKAAEAERKRLLDLEKKAADQAAKAEADAKKAADEKKAGDKKADPKKK